MNSKSASSAVVHDANYLNNMQDMQHGSSILDLSSIDCSNISLKKTVTSPVVTQDANYWNNMQDMQRGGTSKVIETTVHAVNMLHATGTKEEMTKIAHDYADTVGMNKANRDLLVVLKTEGNEGFIKKAFEDPNEKGRTMSYSEMRAMYG